GLRAKFERNARVNRKEIKLGRDCPDISALAHSFRRICYLGKLLQVRELALPGRVHDSEDAWKAFGRFEPLADLFRPMVVITGDDLLVTPIREKLQAGHSLLEVPRQDYDVLIQTFP